MGIIGIKFIKDGKIGHWNYGILKKEKKNVLYIIQDAIEPLEIRAEK